MVKAGTLLKELTEVHIIESPSSQDRRDDRREGYSLGEMLRLSGIDYYLYDVNSLVEFSEAFKTIIERTAPKKRGLGMVTVHISMHGNIDGLGLTNGDFLSWKLFANELNQFKNAHTMIPLPPGISISPIVLSFSSCHGLNGSSINDYLEEQESLFSSLIGPTTEVSWEDALVAFTTYYHLTLSHNVPMMEALNRMNLASNLENVFQYKMGKGMALKP